VASAAVSAAVSAAGVLEAVGKEYTLYCYFSNREVTT
jgi:hypothetical protein